MPHPVVIPSLKGVAMLISKRGSRI
jgi:hypothetical protein